MTIKEKIGEVKNTIKDLYTVEIPSENDIARIRNAIGIALDAMADAARNGEIESIRFHNVSRRDGRPLSKIAEDLGNNSLLPMVLDSKEGVLIITHGSMKKDFRGVGQVQCKDGKAHAVDDRRFEGGFEDGKYELLSCYPAARGEWIETNGKKFHSYFSDRMFPMDMCEDGDDLLYFPCTREYCDMVQLPYEV